MCSREWDQASDDELFGVVQGQLPDAGGSPGSVSAAPAEAERTQALELLFARYHQKVYGWCRKLLADPDLAADAMQDIFLELLVRPRPYQARQRFAPWLYVTTRNRCLNLLRRRSRELEADDRLEQVLAAIADPSDPARDAEQADWNARLDDACQRLLSGREQEVFHLRYVVGLQVAEITTVLGLDNASGARTHLRSAEQKLRRALNPDTSDQASDAGTDGQVP